MLLDQRLRAEQRRAAVLRARNTAMNAQALAPEAGLQFVYSFTDNTNAEGAMRRLAPKTARMQAMVAARSAWMRERGVFESAERITTDRNLWADLGSRMAVAEVERQAALFDMRVRHVQPLPAWRSTTALRCGEGEAYGGGGA